MREDLKQARNYLRDCLRSEFEKAVYEAKLTPIQEKVIREHILNDKSVVAIGMELNCSDTGIRRSLSTGYIRIARYLHRKHS
ncbi:hypothetical protein SAMN02745671_01152 [Anaerovibrio lipolyticus DSM 3074]|uniref:Sigma-70, region 4 n=1 Tax=Anaerovibrio lipolyticus DSM 3074 TaxID=1120997 RepID=A0A1M6CK68_9FIRM|nr:hypothetical protein [Anaerovibrio lipolyticus]SHI61412.1 hypothetical protein SAMN02745671_01152 [Anaerovibrio lipolyticus DSM 3074]